MQDHHPLLKSTALATPCASPGAGVSVQPAGLGAVSNWTQDSGHKHTSHQKDTHPGNRAGAATLNHYSSDGTVSPKCSHLNVLILVHRWGGEGELPISHSEKRSRGSGMTIHGPWQVPLERAPGFWLVSSDFSLWRTDAGTPLSILITNN